MEKLIIDTGFSKDEEVYFIHNFRLCLGHCNEVTVICGEVCLGIEYITDTSDGNSEVVFCHIPVNQVCSDKTLFIACYSDQLTKIEEFHERRTDKNKTPAT
jgi:hypothetical protein